MQLALDLILVFLPLASDSSSSYAFTFVCLVNLPSDVIQTVIPEASEPFETIHLKKILFIYFCFLLRWVFIALHGFSLIGASGGYSLLRCMNFSLQWLLLLHSIGSSHVGFSSCSMQDLGYRGFSSCCSQAQECGLRSCGACRIFQDQEWNLYPLQWQAHSYPLCHKESVKSYIFKACVHSQL